MSSMQQIILKCSCMSKEATLYIRARQSVETIENWMQHLQEQVTFYHQTHHPECKATKLEYLKLPIEENKPIGSGVLWKDPPE